MSGRWTVCLGLASLAAGPLADGLEENWAACALLAMPRAVDVGDACLRWLVCYWALNWERVAIEILNITNLGLQNIIPLLHEVLEVVGGWMVEYVLVQLLCC
jgi:hypothetical protein